jgi:hypothetical protein
MRSLLAAYGAFFMTEGLVVNLLLLASTLVHPLIGLGGLISGSLALVWRQFLGLRPVGPNLEIINSVLVGLLLGETFQPTPPAVILLVCAPAVGHSPVGRSGPPANPVRPFRCGGGVYAGGGQESPCSPLSPRS